MSPSKGKTAAAGGDAAAGGSSSYLPRPAGAAEETMEEARAWREAEKAELEKKIARTKEEIVALEAALAETDAAAGPKPTKP
ncbi:hypothetical protein D1007_39861 [Hordeum vulgare]|nr:hypothetical protein D1007_39861 [Hordeum vulgare]KAI4993300.1 hypothetical protein ZWY2020_007613 [Hordeum vulgare]